MEVIGTDNLEVNLSDEDLQDTGSLLLTADCCEEAPSALEIESAMSVTARTWRSGGLSSNATMRKHNVTDGASDLKVRASRKPMVRIKQNKMEGKAECPKQFSCSVCGKSYMQASSLQTHMRYHTGERPYHCTQCGRTFVQSGHLTSHLRLHTGERNHVCTVCDKRFGAAGDLKVTARLLLLSFVTILALILFLCALVGLHNWHFCISFNVLLLFLFQYYRVILM